MLRGKKRDQLHQAVINKAMESPEEAAEAQVRRFITTLIIARRKRILKTLSEIYGWSPEMLAENEARFIQTADCVPAFVAPKRKTDEPCL